MCPGRGVGGFCLISGNGGVIRILHWNPALRTPEYYQQFRVFPREADIFSLKLTRLIRFVAVKKKMSTLVLVSIRRVSGTFCF